MSSSDGNIQVGEASPSESWDALKGGAILIDVRTTAEWAYVGQPALERSMQPLISHQWQQFPTMQVDTGFADALDAHLQKNDHGKDAPLHFLCRSGVRSLAAAHAMAARGYTNTFNVTAGFEGDPDGQGHRGQVNGWKFDGLPWRQG
ncbi:rhodanese-like domain-containing protein [Ahrensia sp. R2A130]|uniref:rhodanese-like domain-containing protein n=1 Tax=Ahrensia sp. R2A130 TaxID=744979 RepID=UPI0001E0F0A2|nr:rhodanese-like domain-containing protein [Ahrensia sp. R2A130]EFL89905.1 rhodanese domain-containing protein [Ahrensia sp. R2A130]